MIVVYTWSTITLHSLFRMQNAVVRQKNNVMVLVLAYR